MAENHRAIIFDLDGTLIDTLEIVLNTYVATIRLLGRADVTLDDVVANFHIGPTPVLLEHFLGRPVSARDLDAYFVEYEAAITGLLPFPGVVDMLEELHRGGYRLGLFTSATRRAVNVALPMTGLDQYFDETVTGDEVTHPKPDAEGLELICRRLGVRTQDAIYVGDAEVDIACARNAGAIGIQALWSSTAPALDGNYLTAKQPGDVIALITGKKPTF
ncbi:MAG: HAD family hydrolase [Chloroflexi bacterium]|nr:HAD family hydrolase [Chloroflexota bacterium]